MRGLCVTHRRRKTFRLARLWAEILVKEWPCLSALCVVSLWISYSHAVITAFQSLRGGGEKCFALTGAGRGCVTHSFERLHLLMTSCYYSLGFVNNKITWACWEKSPSEKDVTWNVFAGLFLKVKNRSGFYSLNTVTSIFLA